MKKTILFSFILITIIAFSGCSSNVPQISQEDIKSQLKEELKSEIKEELKVGLKEELKSELKEELTKELAGNIPGGTAKPGSLELTADYCYFPEMPGYFSCRYGFLWEEGVEFKMRYLQAGRAVLKKYGLLNWIAALTYRKNLNIILGIWTRSYLTYHVT